MTRFHVHATPLAGLKIIERTSTRDTRGSFDRLFCAHELQNAGWEVAVAQLNYVHTIASGAIRGLHFQTPPYAEMKLVCCIVGSIYDVAIDIRRGSPTFLQWHAEHLSAENGLSLLIPPGFAHGYQTLTGDCHMIYAHSTAYHPEAEQALNPCDPKLAIAWPLPMTVISERDRHHPYINSAFCGIDT